MRLPTQYNGLLVLSRLNLADWLFTFYFLSTAALIIVRRRTIPQASKLLIMHVVGLAFIVLAAHLSTRSRLFSFAHDWYPLVLPIATFSEVAVLSRHVFPGWRDDWFLKFEARIFPAPPTVWFSRHASWWLTEVLQAGYFSYYVFLMIVGGVLYAFPDKAPFAALMGASTLSYLMCYAIFILLPTEGPARTLASKHGKPLPGGLFHVIVNFFQRHAGVHGNAFPSSHVAAALVALLFAWRYAPGTAELLTPFFLLLCVAAVYDRYHYFSDVIGGIVVGLAATGLVWKFSTASTQ